MNIPDLCYDRQKSVRITKDEYNYLLPVPSMKKHLFRRVLAKNDEYYFLGENEDIYDMKQRAQGLYW